MLIKLGTIIDNRYRVVNIIGHGGMAEVYEASDIISKKLVAIKLIREEVMSNPVNLKRFQNEASIAASLNHPNIVKVYNHGTVDGIPYIANEYVKGQTLKDVLDFRSSLPIEETLNIMIQLVSALDYAHKHGIIHRDVKPNNIMLMTDDTIKLADFGIAENFDSKKPKQANNKNIIGSVHYMAPEIASGKEPSPQSDIYAAGITFFELLTGHIPFYDEDPINVAVKQIKEKMPSITKYLPRCPKEIEKIINTACAKKLKDRYQTAQDFYNALVELKKHPELLKEKKSWVSRLFGFK